MNQHANTPSPRFHPYNTQADYPSILEEAHNQYRMCRIIDELAQDACRRQFVIDGESQE